MRRAHSWLLENPPTGLFDSSTVQWGLPAGSTGRIRYFWKLVKSKGRSTHFNRVLIIPISQLEDRQACAFSFAPGSASPDTSYVPRDALIADASDAILIPTYPWFCHAGTCSPVVSNDLVYAVTDHSTIAYSD